MSVRNYNFAADLARALAILGVMAIHVFYPVYSRPDFLGGFSWWLAHTLDVVSRDSVPLFIMISGYLLLDPSKKTPLANILHRSINRIGIPLLFWSAIYFYGEFVWYERMSTWQSITQTFFSASLFHLYFLVIMINLYLLIPVTKTYLKSATGKSIHYLLSLAFVWGAALYALQFFVFKDHNIFNIFTIWLPYYGYFLAGHYLGKKKFTSFQIKIALVIYVGAVLFTNLIGYINLQWFARGQLWFWGLGGSEYFASYLSPNVIAMSLPMFVLIMKTKTWFTTTTNNLYVGVVQKISRSAFGIYLVHIAIINTLDKFFGFEIHLVTSSLWWYLIQKYLLVLLLSWMTVAVLGKIPVVKKVIGG